MAVLRSKGRLQPYMEADGKCVSSHYDVLFRAPSILRGDISKGLFDYCDFSDFFHAQGFRIAPSKGKSSYMTQCRVGGMVSGGHVASSALETAVLRSRSLHS